MNPTRNMSLKVLCNMITAGAARITDRNAATEQCWRTVQFVEFSWTKAVCIVRGFYGRLWQVGEWIAGWQTESGESL